MSADTIKICLSSDNNYAQHLAVTIASILKNRASDDEFYFLILDGDISEENKEKISSLKEIHNCEIEFQQVDNNLFKNCPLQDWTHLSIVTYYRLVLPNLKPDWDRILYLDCDIIVRSSLKELYNLDIGDNYFGVVPDLSSHKHAKRLDLETYYNAGIMVINADKWRKDNITEMLFKWIDENNEKIVLHDQDILNAALADRITPLDEKWNTFYLTRELKENIKKWEKANIIHFVDKKKPWLWHNGDSLANEYLHYIKFTPYKNFLDNYYITITPKTIVLKTLKFVFDAGNIDSKTKYIQILGLRFYRKRKLKACDNK